MGMKEPNTEFDFRNVEEGSYYDYESKIYDFLKPFNVFRGRCRIQTVFWRGLEIGMMEDILYARTS